MRLKHIAIYLLLSQFLACAEDEGPHVQKKVSVDRERTSASFGINTPEVQFALDQFDEEESQLLFEVRFASFQDTREFLSIVDEEVYAILHELQVIENNFQSTEFAMAPNIPPTGRSKGIPAKRLQGSYRQKAAAAHSGIVEQAPHTTPNEHIPNRVSELVGPLKAAASARAANIVNIEGKPCCAGYIKAPVNIAQNSEPFKSFISSPGKGKGSFTNGDNFPGVSGGINSAGLEGQYLVAVDIPPDILPYKIEIRSEKPPAAFNNIDNSKIETTNTYLGSNEHSGSTGVVNVGFFSTEGKEIPVAMKVTFEFRNETEAGVISSTIKEAEALQTYSDLGIGVRFHGIADHPTLKFPNGKPKPALVMDIIPGDFPTSCPSKINIQTFRDLDIILERIPAQTSFGDFQYLITGEGRAIVIDPPPLPSQHADTSGIPRNSPDGPGTRERLSLYKRATNEVKDQYLNELRTSNPEAYSGLQQALGN